MSPQAIEDIVDALHATRRVYVDEPAPSVSSFADGDNDAEVAQTVVSQETAAI